MMLQNNLEVQNIIRIKINVAGRVTQSDIIGAVFGQTEEVLGENLNLRQLQRENKIGRIEVEVSYTEKGTDGLIIIPCYMDITNTVVIAAALETIQKIGPCKASAKISKIENIKEIKTLKIKEYAKKILGKFMSVSIDSQELIDDVAQTVRIEQITTYGEEGVPAGPKLENYEEVIFVETVDELQNLLKYGIKNAVAFEDASKQKTLADIAMRKEVTVFVNKGKDYLVKKLLEFSDVDNYTRPEDHRKRIRDLNSKELFKAIRSSVSCEQLKAKKEYPTRADKPTYERKETTRYEKRERPKYEKREERPRYERKDRPERKFILSEDKKALFAATKSELKKGDVAILDRHNKLLGQIPEESIGDTLGSLRNVGVLIIHGKATNDIISAAEKSHVKLIIADSSERTSRFVNVVNI